jgi:hypothetical protein
LLFYQSMPWFHLTHFYQLISFCFMQVSLTSHSSSLVVWLSVTFLSFILMAVTNTTDTTSQKVLVPRKSHFVI